MYRLVIVRHGESLWNAENRFTGWQDVGLAEKGKKEAHQGGKALHEKGFEFDIVYTSVLKRAIHTMDIILDELDQSWLPIIKDWRLNERHYGGLQGLNKAETAARHGEDQVKIWRRSYDIPPPPMAESDPGLPSKDRRYENIPKSALPNGEALKDTVRRFLPLWHELIVPQIKSSKKVLIVAHGNSLRALMQHLENMTPEQIMEVNMPTGIPMVYDLDSNLKVLKRDFVGDPETVRASIEAVANQGRVKK